MCAIVDANVVKELLKHVGTASSFFLSQVENGKIKIVVGGKKLRDEYWDCGDQVRRWLVGATNAGIVQSEEDGRVDFRAEELAQQDEAGIIRIRSNDYHILALAQISGARLLYSSDRSLKDDFKSMDLINKPRGKVYSTCVHEDIADKHRRLLRQRLCPR